MHPVLIEHPEKPPKAGTGPIFILRLTVVVAFIDSRRPAWLLFQGRFGLSVAAQDGAFATLRMSQWQYFSSLLDMKYLFIVDDEGDCYLCVVWPLQLW